jgi:hypothetical protein
MKINDIYESTTSGSVASVAMPLGGTQKREGSLFKGKKTKKKFYESEVSEAEVNEADLILVPGQGKKLKPGFIPKDKDRTDHEVEMARSDLYQAAKNAQKVYALIQHLSEEEGLEGWVQEKIIKANDYLNTIREYLEHKTHMQETTGGVLAGGMSNFEEGVRDLGYDAQSLIMKLRRDVEEKRLQPTPQAVLAAARELAGDTEFAPQLLVKQVLGQGVAEGWQEDSQELEDWSKEVNKKLYRAHESQRPALAKQLSKIEQKNFGSSLNKGSLTQVVHAALMALQKGNMVHYDPQSVGSMPFGNIVGDDARVIANSGLKKYDVDGYRGLKRAGIVDTIEQFLHLRDLADNQGQAILKYANMPPVAAWMQFIKDIGWSKDDMNEEVQAKTDDKLLAYYAQRKAEKEKEKQQRGVEESKCSECGGPAFSEESIAEAKDACYNKVKSRYKVWPSAYASGALVKCRKVGASNWGNKSKK